MLDALVASDHAKDTLVVLWSDHGWHLGEKQHWAKRSLWEESTRVPLILAGPGLAKGNCKWPVGLIDLYPTLSELCGLGAPPQTLEGHSLVPLLEKPDTVWPPPGNHDLSTKTTTRFAPSAGATSATPMATRNCTIGLSIRTSGTTSPPSPSTKARSLSYGSIFPK